VPTFVVGLSPGGRIWNRLGMGSEYRREAGRTSLAEDARSRVPISPTGDTWTRVASWATAEPANDYPSLAFLAAVQLATGS
jgi:hypothetical protein